MKRRLKRFNRIPFEGKAYCSYCQQFYKSKIINKVGDRYCEKLKEDVMEISRNCKDFKLVDYFYCNKLNERIPFLICGIRRINHKEFNRYQECKKCRQYKELKLFVPEKHEIDKKYFYKIKKKEIKKKTLKRRLKFK